MDVSAILQDGFETLDNTSASASTSSRLVAQLVQKRMTVRPSDSFSMKPISTTRSWLPENHELANHKRLPVDRLADYPFIITQPGKDTDIDRLLANAGVSVDVRFATKDAYSTYRMVEAGLGISLNQRLIARD